MATSLAAAIESAFDLKVILVEGHNGIYEVSAGEDLIYTNQSSCSKGFPSHEHIVEQIGQFLGVVPKQNATLATETDPGQAASCAIPNRSKENNPADSFPMANPAQSDCGCGPSNSASSTGGSCCDPNDSSSNGAGCCDNPSGTSGGSLLKKLMAGAVIVVALTLAGMSMAKKAGWYGDITDQVDSLGVLSSGTVAASCETPTTNDSLLAKLVGEQEAIFALLPCDHEEHVLELRDQVSPVIQKLQARGKRTELVVVDPTSAAYSSLVELHTAESYPCLAVIGTSCASSLISDNFTEERLFSAFVGATSPASASSCSTPCGSKPSDSSSTAASCCPK